MDQQQLNSLLENDEEDSTSDCFLDNEDPRSRTTMDHPPPPPPSYNVGKLVRIGTATVLCLAAVMFLQHHRSDGDGPPGIHLENEDGNTLPSGLDDEGQTSDLDADADADADATPAAKAEIKNIYFIGERHTGTKWIISHLEDCFDHKLTIQSGMSRWKHWFQYQRKMIKNGLVVAQFRNVYDWVEAMRQKAYHAPAHAGLEWNEFVTKPWTMPRYGIDLELEANLTDPNERICGQHFRFNELVPCAKELFQARYAGGDDTAHPRYELQLDGSGKPYDSIVDLRGAKIRNFLSVADFDGVEEFLPVRYDGMVSQGTKSLIDEIEKLTGVEARCQPYEAQDRPAKVLDPEYKKWMDKHVDWEAEKLIGFEKRSRNMMRH